MADGAIPGRWRQRAAALAGALILLGAAILLPAYLEVQGRTVMELRIRQDLDLILFSDFGEPPQFAVWLEDPDTGAPRTVFVTYRSATGDWKGKAECPASLPRWFAIHCLETGKKGFPRMGAEAPDAVTGATPPGEDILVIAELEPSSRWICWIEVNLSADYNEHFPQHDERSGTIDTDQSGQPSLLYRAAFTALAGTRAVPELFGYSVPYAPETIERDLSGITTARDIFQSIELRVVRPPLEIF